MINPRQRSPALRRGSVMEKWMRPIRFPPLRRSNASRTLPRWNRAVPAMTRKLDSRAESSRRLLICGWMDTSQLRHYRFGWRCYFSLCRNSWLRALSKARPSDFPKSSISSATAAKSTSQTRPSRKRRPRSSSMQIVGFVQLRHINIVAFLKKNGWT